MNITELYQCFLQCDQVSTDSRNIGQNSLFFALKGENFDANSFAEQAIANGASFAVIDNQKYFTDKKKMILVSDALGALQQLAKYHRQQLGLPIIALTGSNGKTTTKELIKQVLSKNYHVEATKGNLNNHIGVPLTLLSFNDSTDIGIVEMGANHAFEIAFLCELADPDFGYITNFGKAHLEGFGSFEGVIKAKSELYQYLEDHHKLAFTNIDDPRQDAKTLTFSRYTFGTDPGADMSIERYSATPNATVYYKNTAYTSNLVGLYNAENIAAAMAIGVFFNVPITLIQEAIASYTSNNNRSQWIKKQDIQILLDAYNANPSSMELAIDHFLTLESPLSKTIILGDMFELGNQSHKEHLLLVEQLQDRVDLKVYLIGQQFFKHSINKADHLHFFATYSEFEEYINRNENFLKHQLVLIKGSRTMALERILSCIN